MAYLPKRSSHKLGDDKLASFGGARKKRTQSGRMIVPSTVVITGGTGVLGNAMVRELIKVPGLNIHVLCRSEEKFNKRNKNWEKLKEDGVSIHPWIVDLASKKSINAFLDKFRSEVSFLDVLFCAAACAPEERTSTTEEKIETQFCVNLLSYYRLTKGLLPVLNKSVRKGGGRAIFMADKRPPETDFDVSDLQFRTRKYTNIAAYNQSKAGIRMMTAEAHRKWGKVWANVSFFCCHPGESVSPTMKAMGLESAINTPMESAETPVWLILDSKLGTESSGKYWMSKKESRDRYSDHKDSDKLWQILESFSADIKWDTAK